MNYEFEDVFLFCLFIFGIIAAFGAGVALVIRMIRFAITGA